MNIAHHLDRVAALRPDGPALAHGDHVVADFARLRARVARMAGALSGRLALKPGDRVVVLMANSPAYVEILFACWWAGLAAVPVNAKLHAREVAYVLDHSGARLAFFSPDTSALLAEAMRLAEGPASVAIESGSPDYDALDRGEPGALAEVDAGSLAWLF